MTTTKLYRAAELAEASYADFSDPTNSLKNALTSEEFSSAQAAEFIKHWKVAHHLPNTDTGFSATLFESLDNPGEFTFAIRGTEFFAGFFDDLATDIGDITIDGLALEQIVDMYNYWQWLNAPKGSTYQVARLQSLGVYLPVSGQTPADISDGIVVDNPGGELNTIVFEFSDVVYAATDEKVLGLGITAGISAIDVTGHSLGGHLAVAFTRLFPETNPVAYTINGAGFRLDYPNVDNLFNMLAQGGTQFESSRILNLYGSTGPEVVTQDLGIGLSQLGGHEAVYIEQDPWYGNTFGHGSSQMTNSLAVYDLFFRLSTSFGSATPADALSTLNPLFEAASNQAETTLESLVGALYDLFVSPGGTPTKIADGDRDELYQHINAVRDAITGLPPMGFDILIGKSQDDLVELAKNDVAYRYALKQLNPFAITGNNGLYRFEQNENGELDLYDPETGTGMTEDYLMDRARFLTLKLRLGVADTEQEFFSREGNSTFKDVQHDLTLHTNRTHTQGSPKGEIIFDDKQSQRVDGGSASDRLYGGDGVDFVYGYDGEDYIEGNVGDDHLIGGAGADTLLGGEGNDRLYGGDEDKADDNAHDMLKGGLGNDTYYVGNADVIDDHDGQGEIYIDDLKISGRQIESVPDADRLYIDKSDPDKVIYFRLDDNDTLVVSGEARFEIRNFKEGDFGISFKQPEDDAPDREVRFVYRDGYVGRVEDYDQSEELWPDPTYYTAAGANINGRGGSDLIYGGEYNDEIKGHGDLSTEDNFLRFVEWHAGYQPSDNDDDILYGGGGRDWLYGDEGDDRLYGEEGEDRLQGHIGNDLLDGGADDDVAYGLWGDDIVLGGDGNDHLEGDSIYLIDDVIVSDSWDINIGGVTYTPGDDYLDGGRGEDELFGGPGDDILFGGEDNDFVHGDSNRKDEMDNEGGIDYLSGDAGDDRLFGGVDNDVLHGGTGNDELAGDDPDVDGALHGDDHLEGGIGEDVLWGEGGNDTLYGGADNDLLFGDYPELEGQYHGLDVLRGGEGNDQLSGGGHDDILEGGEGDDELFGDNDNLAEDYHGNDILSGGAGDDFLRGHGGDDQLDGGSGNDQLVGGEGSDQLDGGEGNDILAGEKGDDHLAGGQGDDQLARISHRQYRKRLRTLA